MVKRAKNGQFAKGIDWQHWISKAIQVIPILVAFYALIQTSGSIEESKRSADAAQDALTLSQKQYYESKERDSIQGIQDSIKTVRSIVLTEKQILALKEQAAALEKGIKNTEISQKPYLDILNLGFHFADKEFKKEYNYSDSLVLGYKVINYGVRPAILKEVILYEFDKNYNPVLSEITKLNTLISSTKVFHQTLLVPHDKGGRRKIGLQEITMLNDIYLCFVFKYKDEFTGKEIDTKNAPIIYKWVNREQNANWFVNIEGSDVFLSFDICSDKEELAIKEALKKGQ